MNKLATVDDVLHLWFGEPGAPPLTMSKRWFAKDEAFDQLLRDQFQTTLEAGARGELDDWKSTPRGRLALIILFDQFSRNIFRGTPKSFAQDPLALALTLEALDAAEDRHLALMERYFLLMPLMHAESVELQHRCVAEFEKLLAQTSEDLKAMLASAVDYAKRHAVIVERFRRFPHRNGILGRESTAEEAAFLTQPGSSF